jgi:NADPH:quinone reductase-like Zn-dependent oxidoreductase
MSKPTGADQSMHALRAQLAELTRRIDAGRLQPVIGRVWPLAEGRQAFEAKQRSGLPGKVTLQVTDDWHAVVP